jgi:predicted dehydrogenase
MTVIGSERMVVFDDMETERKVTVYDKGPIPRTETYGEYIQVRSGDIHIPKVTGTEPLRVVCERFVQAVGDRAPTPSDGWAGATVVEVLEAMGESLAQGGKPVALAGAVV